MKKYLLFTILVLSLVLSACGAPPPPPQTTREQQLNETGLFGRHPVDGVTKEQTVSGSISGGFFLFAAGMNGAIDTATNYVIQWRPEPNIQIQSVISRAQIRLVIVEGQTQPEMEIIFKQAWLTNRPSFYDDNTFTDDHNNINYTEGSKLNLNNFIKEANIDIVNIYISPQDLLPPQ